MGIYELRRRRDERLIGHFRKRELRALKQEGWRITRRPSFVSKNKNGIPIEVTT